MKYFSPSYWFKLWLLSAPLFNDETQGINAKSIDNKKIKDWASKNISSLDLINQNINQKSIINQPYSLLNQSNQNYLDLQNYASNLNTIENHQRNKRDFYAKEQIEFFNNHFFYKFNIKYDKEKSTNGAWDVTSSLYTFDSITLVENWNKYANSLEEFSIKFPDIELINFKCIIADNEKIKENIKIKNIKNEKSEWSQNQIYDFFNGKYTDTGKCSSVWDKSATELDIIELNSYCDKSGVCTKRGKILFRLYVDKQKLKAQIIYYLKIATCLSSYKGILKFDSIRLVGEIDVNPLFSLTVEKAQQFDIWASSQERELKGKKEDPNYNKTHLLNEENSFKENFKLWLLQIRHDYIQDLININQNNEIINLKSEIDDIKSRLDKLEKSKTCLDNIYDSFKKNSLSDAGKNTWNSIKENSESPLKVIIKKSGKAFATGLLTGVAKGSALGILSCVADSLLSSRKRREITNINDLEEKNVTKWTDDFSKSINNEQHLPIDNKTNFTTSNITSL